MNFLIIFSSMTECSSSLSEILSAHILIEQYPALDDDDDITFLSVRRSHLWHDSVAQFTKLSFDPKKTIRVIFHGEEAVDGGGPCREFFRLLCSEIRERSGLFTSKDRVVNFSTNISLIVKQQFRLAGVMIATSIVNGGPGFPFLPKCIYDYIVRRRIDVDATIDDLTDFATGEVASKVYSCTCDLVLIIIYFHTCIPKIKSSCLSFQMFLHVLLKSNHFCCVFLDKRGDK